MWVATMRCRPPSIRRIWPARAACTKLAVDGSSGVPQTQPGRITTVAIWVPLAAWTAWSARVLDAAYPEQRGCCSGQLSSAPVTGSSPRRGK